MRGSVKKRATWQYTVELGLQPLQRCAACKKRYWIRAGGRQRHCPRCRGPLEEGMERRQETKTGFRTKREAEEAMATALGAVVSGTYVVSSKMRLDEFLRKEWLPAIEPTVRSTTYLGYVGHVENHLIPSLGRTPLQQLTGAHINAFYARLLSDGRKGRDQTYAPATVRRIHATLHRALRDAVRWSRIGRNPADAADPPRAATCADAEINLWSMNELHRFLDSVRETHNYPLWLTLITTGIRRGEAMGLRWQDVDLRARTLAVRQTRVLHGYQPLLSSPKTKKGKRMVALDPATVACLQGLLAQQEREERRVPVSEEEADLVFRDEDGLPLHPDKATALFQKAIKKAGVPTIRLHDLRHTHASLALSAGVHPKVVSERLGHANIGITLDTYSHCVPALSRAAARKVASLVIPKEEPKAPKRHVHEKYTPDEVPPDH